MQAGGVGAYIKKIILIIFKDVTSSLKSVDVKTYGLSC